MAVVFQAHAQSGLPLWTNRFNGVLNGNDESTGIAVDRKGNVFVTGTTLDPNGQTDYATIAYSNAGMPLWTNYYDGPGSGRDVPNGIVVNSNGNVIVTGRSWSGFDYTSTDFATIAYSLDGSSLWTNRYDGPGYGADWTMSIAADRDGNVFVTGQSWAGSSFETTDYVTVAYSNAGLPLWTNRYDGPSGGEDYANAIAVDHAGTVFVTGSSRNDSEQADCLTIAYSNSGLPLWTNRYSRLQTDYTVGSAIAADAKGTVFVAGGAAGTYGIILAYSSAGIPLWTNIYLGPTDRYSSLNAMAVDPAGNVLVAGESRGSDTTAGADYVTVAFSGLGMPLWTNVYNGPGRNADTANATAVDYAGNVFVTGFSYRSSTYTSSDYATIAYSGAGVPLWTNRYNGPRNDEDAALACAEDSAGNVYVTGRCAVSSGNSDFATIKYSSSVQAKLDIQKVNQNVVLTWADSAFSLQSAPSLSGNFTNIPGAFSPHTNPITGSLQFFRLKTQ